MILMYTLNSKFKYFLNYYLAKYNAKKFIINLGYNQILIITKNIIEKINIFFKLNLIIISIEF